MRQCRHGNLRRVLGIGHETALTWPGAPSFDRSSHRDTPSAAGATFGPPAGETMRRRGQGRAAVRQTSGAIGYVHPALLTPLRRPPPEPHDRGHAGQPPGSHVPRRCASARSNVHSSSNPLGAHG